MSSRMVFKKCDDASGEFTATSNGRLYRIIPWLGLEWECCFPDGTSLMSPSARKADAIKVCEEYEKKLEAAS